MTSAVHWQQQQQQQQQQHIHEPSPQQQQPHHRHHHHRAWDDDQFRDSPVEEEEEVDEDEGDEGMILEDGSSMSSSPSIPDENINFDLVYALHTFVATVEGQASVVKGDALILMEDTNIYWWLVEVLKTREVGYIPAENIETPYERLARLNKHRNVEITSPSATDATRPAPKFSYKNVTIAGDDATRVIHYEVESQDEYGLDSADEEDLHYQDSHDSAEVADEITAAPESLAVPEDTGGAGAGASGGPKEPLRVFAGNIGQEAPLFHTFSIDLSTAADELVKDAVSRFALDHAATEGTIIEYYIAVQGLDGDDYVLAPQDKPLSIFKTLTAPLTTPMPSVSHIKQPQPNAGATPSSEGRSARRPRSSSFSNYEQTSYDADSVIRFYLHRRIKRAHEQEGIFYIKVSLYPDDGAAASTGIPAADQAHAFTTNPTPVAPGKKKKLMASRQEIDRIDKIMSVKEDQQIGSVINMALDKFHVPDAEADGYHSSQPASLGPTERCLTKYRMSVRAANGVETPLDPRDHMASALHHQQQTSPVTSDLLFILRRADAQHYRKAQAHPPPTLAAVKPGEHSSSSDGGVTMMPEERRPSILDILMDSPRSADPRGGFLDDRRPSFPSSLSSQERKSSLTPYPGTPTTTTSAPGDWAPHSPSTSSLSAPTPGFRRTSVMSSSNISGSSSVYSDCDTTADMKPQHHPSADGAARKKESSLKQQLKRLVGWGSKTKKSPPPPLQQQHQGSSTPSLLQHPTTPATTANESALSVKPAHHASSSQVSVVSAPPTPLTPTPHSGQPRVQPKITSATAPSTPVAASTPFSPVKANAADPPITNESAVSAAPTSSTSSLSSDDDDDDDDDVDAKEPIELSDDSSSDDDDDDATSSNGDAVSTISRNKALPNKPGDPSEIQAQYTMWMDSQQDGAAPKRESKTEFIESPLPPLPADSSSPPPVADGGSSSTSPPSSLSSCSTTAAQQQQQQQDPAAAGAARTSTDRNGLDDLFLLVTRGVDYLQSRESSKWDDDTGYQFHPWNRPDGSFVIRKKPEPQSLSLVAASAPPSSHEHLSEHAASESVTSSSQHEDNASSTSSSSSSGDQASPARSNSTSSSKVAKAPPSQQRQPAPPASAAAATPAQPNETVIDENELQRIVAAHIVF